MDRDRTGPTAAVTIEGPTSGRSSAVWRRFTLGDNFSIADLHRIIQVLMGWDDEHLHRFRIHGQDYGIEYIDGIPFDEDAEAVSSATAVPLSRFRFQPAERVLYEYDFTDGWEIEIRVEKVIDEAVAEEKLILLCAWPAASQPRRTEAVAREPTLNGVLTRLGPEPE